MQFARQSNKSALLLAAALMALVAALALSSVAHAAGSLSFGDAPTGWSITPGEADGNIGKVKATGVKKNRIRYAISGASGFSIKAKSGVVSYDGSAASGSEALLLVTARDRKGKVENATVTVTVSVAGATEPAVEVKRHVPEPPTAQQMQHNHADELKIVQSKLVRRHYRDGESRGRPAGYYTTLEPVGRLHISKAYEGSGLGGRNRGVAFLESNESSVKWTIDDASMRHGFKLGRMDGSSYTSLSLPTGKTAQEAYNAAGSGSSDERLIAVHYDGTKWPGEGYGSGTLGYTLDIEVTGTDHMGRQVTVEIEVCLTRSQ